MKSKINRLMIIGALTAIVLTGCGADSNNAESEVVPSNETEAMAGAESQTTEGQETESLSEDGKAILEYETKLGAGEFTPQDYLALGDLYAQNGMVKKQRDLLEQCWRLWGDTESFEQLQGITVNLAEEDAAVKAEAERLYQNLSIAEYVDEGVGMLLSSDWTSVMMPKLREGRRNYYMNTENGETLYIQIGYDNNSEVFSQVWYLKADNKVDWIRRKADTIQMVSTSLTDGKYDGAFEAWLCVGSTGDVYHETGTFTQGIMTGDYIAKVRFGKGNLDLFVLWGTRASMDLVTYNGNFGTDGITTLEQPEAGKRKVTNGNGEEGYVIYAYDEEKEKYLFVNAPDGEGGQVVFDTNILGMEPYPVYTVYEPVAQEEGSASGQIDASAVQVRIYDNCLQWFDGSRWHTAGSVDEYAQADPFQAYEDGAAAGAGNQEIGEGTSIPPNEEADNQEPQENAVYGNRGGGAIVKPAKPSTSKPSTGKPATPPAAPQAPVVPETPQTPETPAAPQAPAAPQEPDEPDEPQAPPAPPVENQPEPTPPAENQPEPTPPAETPSEDNNAGNTDSGENSGDTDIEWTPDIL